MFYSGLSTSTKNLLTTIDIRMKKNGNRDMWRWWVRKASFRSLSIVIRLPIPYTAKWRLQWHQRTDHWHIHCCRLMTPCHLLFTEHKYSEGANTSPIHTGVGGQWPPRPSLPTYHLYGDCTCVVFGLDNVLWQFVSKYHTVAVREDLN